MSKHSLFASLCAMAVINTVTQPAVAQENAPPAAAKVLPQGLPTDLKALQLPQGIKVPKEVEEVTASLEALTQLQEKYIAIQEKIVALRQRKLALGKGDVNLLDAAKIGLLQSKLGIEKDQLKKIEFLKEIVKLRTESHARSQRKQKNGKNSEDDTLMQEVQLVAAQIELLKAEKK
ncbi:hypothetical protein RF679_16820 [Undibacterium cyanobacteriorum]|uniref:Uncharacterized protein n=1 Tax=Undibacterium cyanobacteriorum TaxID=3073561 RepID=A0ABY9RJ33_9BURK|nr:hypothetical protein [Undibacterium sp. 20NA77.5]WMW80290.1 hypothetical protein RF679_16820 [Undibacterium sp. 20NA77.5]